MGSNVSVELREVYQHPDLYYLHGDHLGTATFVTNSQGDATQFFLNLPFGETMLEQMDGSYNNPYKFNAKELDEDTGLYYYGARYYNPRLSIWYGVDPMAEKYPEWSPYNYTFDNPINYIDPDGRDGIRVVDKENKTITIKSVYYVQTEKSTFENVVNKMVTVNGYTSGQVARMNKNINKTLNKLNETISEGEYAGYSVKYDLEFKEGGTLENAEKLANSEKYEGHSIGNSLRNGNEASDPVYFKKTVDEESGTYSVAGGITRGNKHIVMNNDEGDNEDNKVHEIFHTFGMSHPKGKGGNKGIMKYPPEKPNQNDTNFIGNGSFMPAIEKKKK